MEELALMKKFIEIQGWLLLMFFICLHNQLSSFTSIIVQMSEKCDSSNRLGFCFNIRKRFFLEF